MNLKQPKNLVFVLLFFTLLVCRSDKKWSGRGVRKRPQARIQTRDACSTMVACYMSICQQTPHDVISHTGDSLFAFISWVFIILMKYLLSFFFLQTTDTKSTVKLSFNCHKSSLEHILRQTNNTINLQMMPIMRPVVILYFILFFIPCFYYYFECLFHFLLCKALWIATVWNVLYK